MSDAYEEALKKARAELRRWENEILYGIGLPVQLWSPERRHPIHRAVKGIRHFCLYGTWS